MWLRTCYRDRRNVGRIKGGTSVLHPGFGCISTHIVQWQCFVPGFVKLAFSVWYETDSETCVKEGVVLLGVQCSGGTVCCGTHILTCRTLDIHCTIITVSTAASEHSGCRSYFFERKSRKCEVGWREILISTFQFSVSCHRGTTA